MILITADVHIHNYSSYNLFDNPSFRLEQFEKLANRLSSAAWASKVNDIVICGDLIHVSSPRPVVVNQTFNFLEILATYANVHIICGNHDMDSRSYAGEQHTLLSICNRIPKVFYRDDEIVDINGTLCYFLGYRDNWIDYVKDNLTENVDIVFGHVMPYGVKIGQGDQFLYGGEDLSGIPTKLAFVGDIHRHQALYDGKVVVPGSPIQHGFGDHPNTGFVLLDEKRLTWKHHSTIIKGWDFLRLLKTDEEIDDPYVITRPTMNTEITHFQTKVESGIDTLSVIKETIEDNDLQDLHSELIGSVPKDIRVETDLNFALESVKIENFRSIANFEWDRVNEGVKLVYGRNGTGKSSLVNAIMFALTGTGSARSLAQNGKKHMSVEVTLLYGRFRHTIRRGWRSTGGGNLYYDINGEQVQAENQRALSQRINENLPFIQFSDLFYHDQERVGFLSSYNYAARVDLVSRVLGLKIVDELQKAALDKTLTVDNEISKLREQLASTTSIIDQESLVDFSSMEMVDEDTEKNLRELFEATKKMLETEREQYLDNAKREASLTSNIERTSAAILESRGRQQDLERQTCYTCGQSINESQYQKIFDEISEQVARQEEALEYYKSERSHIVVDDRIIKGLEMKVESLSSKFSEMIFIKAQAAKLEKLKNSIDKAKNDSIIIKNQLAEVEKVRDDLSLYRKLMDANGPIMRSLLTTVSELLTSDTIRVRAHKQLVNKEIRPDFGVDMKVTGQGWVPYDELSGGQKAISDLAILEKLIKLAGGVGLLIFDETFKSLDNENLEVAVDLLKSLQCHSVFIISHEQVFPYWDITIQTKVDKVGGTVYTTR